MIISRWILLRMRSISDKIVVKVETHTLYSINVIGKSWTYKVMWKTPERIVAKAAQRYIART